MAYHDRSLIIGHSAYASKLELDSRFSDQLCGCRRRGLGGVTPRLPVGITIAFVGTILLCPITIFWLRRHDIIDRPKDRSSHASPTLRGGGVAPALASLLALILVSRADESQELGLLCFAFGCGVVGLIEDVHGLKALVRLGLQTIIATIAAAILLDKLFGGAGSLLSVFIASIWLVGFTNVFNFMDGINGISSVQIIFAGSYWALVGAWQHQSSLQLLGAIVAAAALAFLPYNFPRPHVFLGDVGSYFFGAWLASLVVYGVHAGLRPELVLAPLSIYLVDTSYTLLRRVMAGESPLEPHRQHIYQQLVQSGRSHTQVTVLVGALVIISCGLGLLAGTGGIKTRVAADSGIAVTCLLYLSLASSMPRIWARVKSI